MYNLSVNTIQSFNKYNKGKLDTKLNKYFASGFRERLTIKSIYF